MENRSINQNFGNMREKVRLVLMHHFKLQHQNQRLDTYCTLRTQSSLFHQKFHSKVQNRFLFTCLTSFLKKIFTINNTSRNTKILTKNINYSEPMKFRIWFSTTLLLKFTWLLSTSDNLRCVRTFSGGTRSLKYMNFSHSIFLSVL